MAEISFDDGGIGADFGRRALASNLPSAITITRVHSDMTNSMLCSITTKVARFSRLIAASRSFRSPSMVRLTPPAGSSSSTSRGPPMNAIAASSSFCWP